MKNLIKIMILILSMLTGNPVLAGNLNQEEINLAREGCHSLGFAAGSTYGIGLSYSRDWDAWGFQVTALPVWDAEDGGLVAGGLNFKRNFHSNGQAGVYGSFGVAGMMSKDVWEEHTWDPETGEETLEIVTETSQNYAFGPGVGMEFLFWNNVLFRFELPLAIRNGTDGFGISPIPNAALMYRWE